MPPELDVPDLPHYAWHVWSAYHRLSVTRQNGMHINAISYQEMQAYCRMTGDTLAPWEVEAISGIDAEFITYITEQNKKTKGDRND